MKLIIPLVIIFLSGCKSDNIPGNILPKEKMEKVLWEMLQAEEWAYHAHPADSIARKQAALENYAKVYQLNEIDSATFSRSYNYYCEHPTVLLPVLDSARNRAAPPSVDPSDAKPRKVFPAL